jgi:SDR family mycofactocin-dependent oxidoreductase
MKRFEGKTVFITGAARGQGRSHAIGFAREGANVVALDIAAPIDGLEYELATVAELEETQGLVEEQDRQCLAIQADVRDRAAMREAVERALAEFGAIDVVLANAGVVKFKPVIELEDEAWDSTVDTILDGTWNTIKPILPHMIERGSGRIIITGSGVVRRCHPGCVPYLAAKMGLVGIAKGLSQEVMQLGITVNLVHPGMVNTPILLNDAVYKAFLPAVENPTQEEAEELFRLIGPDGEPYVFPEDITDGMLFLASEAAKRITGMALDVSGGMNSVQAG